MPPEPAPHPDVYDPEATLPSMRSGGLQLYLDGRGATVIDAIQQSKVFNQALESGGAQPRPFYAEDLVRGYRLDVWESRAAKWLSLHRRKGAYAIGEEYLPFNTEDEEGFFQLAATQPAPGAPTDDKDLYVHEIIARWAGWSLSVPFPGKALSRHADPDKAIPPDGDDADYRTDEPITAFKVRARPVRSCLARCRNCASACATGCGRGRSILPATASASVTPWPTRSPCRWHCRPIRKAVRTCATSPSRRRWS